MHPFQATPSEGSHPPTTASSAGGPRRHKKRRSWLSCIPGSSCSKPAHGTSNPPPREKDSISTHAKTRGRRSPSSTPRFFSLAKLKRSFSVHGAMSVVAPEIDVEHREGRGKEDDVTASREIPAIIVDSVRPTFLQRLFAKGGRERKRKLVGAEARRAIPPQRSCSEIVPHPSPPGDQREGRNSRRSRELHGSHSSPRTERRTTHLPSKKKACKPIGKRDSLAGFVILIVVLLMLTIGGRLVAIISTSAFFYLASYFRSTPTAERSDLKEEKHVTATVVVDYRSQEYRKKVLMDGLLRRDGRRCP